MLSIAHHGLCRLFLFPCLLFHLRNLDHDPVLPEFNVIMLAVSASLFSVNGIAMPPTDGLLLKSGVNP